MLDLLYNDGKQSFDWNERCQGGCAVLQTERFVIRPYSDADQARMIELLTDESIKETFIIPDYTTLAEAATMSEKLKCFSYTDEHYEKGIYADSKLRGFVNDVGVKGVSIEIGYVIHPGYQNNGFATEALSAVIDDLFRKGYWEVRGRPHSLAMLRAAA